MLGHRQRLLQEAGIARVQDCREHAGWPEETTEILSYLEGITNQENAAGQVKECIEQTQLAQDSYLERLKAAVNRLAVVQLEAESLLAPAAPPTGDGDAPQQADAPLARYNGGPNISAGKDPRAP